jgi:hypothetical protein
VLEHAAEQLGCDGDRGPGKELPPDDGPARYRESPAAQAA